MDRQLQQSNPDICGHKQINSDIELPKSIVMEFLARSETTSFTSKDVSPSTEQLMILSHECDRQKSKYTTEDMYLMHQYLRHASRIAQVTIAKTPKWFIPIYDIELDIDCSWMDGHAIQRGVWGGLPVTTEAVVNQAGDQFESNVAARMSLMHSHLLGIKDVFHLD